MSEIHELNSGKRSASKGPILQIIRLNYIRINAKVLDATDEKLKQYLQFAGAQMNTEVTNDDVVEYALNRLFDRDSAFKSWLKQRT